jgi:hypothetical protein
MGFLHSNEIPSLRFETERHANLPPGMSLNPAIVAAAMGVAAARAVTVAALLSAAPSSVERQAGAVGVAAASRADVSLAEEAGAEPAPVWRRRDWGRR